MKHPEIIIVGAGLAGLCAAIHLQRAGLDPVILERSDAVGGRVRSDRVRGFVFDRGFQVLLKAYPECRRMLDYEALDLRSFEPGARVFRAGSWHTVADPVRRPLLAMRSMANPVGSGADKMRVLRLVRGARSGSLKSLFHSEEVPTVEALRAGGFSPEMIDAFFRPFLGGIFLERNLATSSRMMNFVLRMMACGETAIPASGMQAIPEQLAAMLKPGTVRLNCGVASADDMGVTLETGERVAARAVIVATEAPAATRLLGERAVPPRAERGVTCLYFASGAPPFEGAWLALNGEARGPVNNLCAPTNLAPGMAPPGTHLISATVLGLPRETEGELVAAVRRQMESWFGPAAQKWEYLRTYRIAHAQPSQLPGARVGEGRARLAGPRVAVCGDHTESASIHGAMLSGRRAALLAAQALGSRRLPGVAH